MMAIDELVVCGLGSLGQLPIAIGAADRGWFDGQFSRSPLGDQEPSICLAQRFACLVFQFARLYPQRNRRGYGRRHNPTEDDLDDRLAK